MENKENIFPKANTICWLLWMAIFLPTALPPTVNAAIKLEIIMPAISSLTRVALSIRRAEIAAPIAPDTILQISPTTSLHIFETIPAD